jgi:redox-sensitive bicupin YhaK (pirin superfamily)
MSDPVIRIEPLGQTWQAPDPFLFCVHHDDDYPHGNAELGPAASLDGRDLGQDFGRKDGWSMYHGESVPGFPAHPHRGFETVTIVRRGLIDHSDSLGAAARFGRGDVQWLTAGKGIVHSEMFPLLEQGARNPLELFQIWLNSAAADKLVDPHFSMFWNDQIPRRVDRDSDGRETTIDVIAGALGDLRPLAPPPRSWAARPDADVAIWTIKLSPGARWTVPAAQAGTNRTLFFFRGSSLRAADHDVRARHAIVVHADRSVTLANGPDEAELLVLQGRPIGEPVVQYGPFVMNTRAEIQAALSDYQRTRFGGWPWPSEAPVHARDERRFARHVDGRREDRA